MHIAILLLFSLTFGAMYIEKGPQGAMLIGLLVLGLWITWRDRTTLMHFFKTHKNARLCLLVMGLTLLSWGYSCATGLVPAYHMEQWSRLLATAVGALVIFATLMHLPEERLQRLPAYITWSMMPFVLLTLIEFSPYGTSVTELLRGHEGMPRVSYFSSIIAMALPFMWVYALRHHKQPWVWSLPMLAIAAMVMTGGRSGWVAGGVILLIFIFAYRSWGRSLPVIAKKTFLFLLHVVMGGALGLFLVAQNAFYKQRLIARTDITRDVDLSAGRFDIWQVALDAWATAPFFGAGIKSFRHMEFEQTLRSSYHPHNALLEMGMDTGLVGLGLFSILCLGIFAAMLKALVGHRLHRNTRQVMVACVAALGAFGTASMFLTSIFHSWWLAYLILLLSLGAVLTTKRTD